MRNSQKESVDILLLPNDYHNPWNDVELRTAFAKSQGNSGYSFSSSLVTVVIINGQ